jgi:hypothetical protein
MEVEHREGGRTLHVSQLSAVFLDDHESWYAVHWTTQLRPSDFANFADQYLKMDDNTPTVLQTSKEMKSGPFWSQHIDINHADESAVRFVRLDAQDFVLVWEPGAQPANPDMPYSAIIGFGTDAYDPDFGVYLMQNTAAKDIVGESSAIWHDELDFLQKSFPSRRIDSTKRYEDG